MGFNIYFFVIYVINLYERYLEWRTLSSLSKNSLSLKISKDGIKNKNKIKNTSENKNKNESNN